MPIWEELGGRFFEKGIPFIRRVQIVCSLQQQLWKTEKAENSHSSVDVSLKLKRYKNEDIEQ